MDKELLMLYGARFAVIRVLESGGKWFSRTVENDDKQSVEYADICNYLTKMIDKYKALEQEPKTGHWIEEYIGCMYDVCSECGQKVTTGYFKYNFCPNCGARMVEPQESET